MKTRHWILLAIAWLFQLQFVFAQTNKLYIEPTDCPIGTTSHVAIRLDNQSEVVALQFNIHLPDVVRLADDNMILSEERKADDHTISIRNRGENNYQVIVWSLSNAAFKGNSGTLIELPLEIPDDLEIDKEYPFTFSEVVASDRNARNVLTASDPGSIRIVDGNGPDITANTIQLTSDNFKPGGKVSIAWTVQNVGGRATEAGWNEQVYLVDELGNEYFLGRLSCEEILAASGAISRQAEFNLSEYPGVEGTVKAKVALTPFADLGELPVDAENNEVTSTASLILPKLLTWRINASSIQEAENQEIYCFLNRSGSRLNEETFTLTQSATGRLELPASVTIPQGESGVSFTMKTINDDVANRDSFVVVTVAGNGYPDLKQEIWIEDDETPALTITAPEERQQEGNTFKLTISRPWATEWPLEVRLSTDHPKRFTFASTVTIPKDVASVEVPVQVVEDDIPDVNVITAVFNASQSGYETGVGFVEVEDDDVPDIDLEITPTILPEGGGPQAAIATLRRTGVTDNKITIKLTDTSDGLLYYPSSSITLDSGETEYQFAIGISDNDQQEGDREVTLNASVYISTCDCSTAGTNVGTVTKKITITDNDGPTLTLSSSQTSLIEGKEQATVLTVTRNTATTDALTVTISCDRPEEVTYTSTVTIPAGESSVDVPVAVKKNDTTEGNRTISFTATADGYSSGTCWAMITDQTLPDAVITDLSISSQENYVQDKVLIAVSLTNKGTAILPAKSKVSIYISNNKLLSSATYKELLGNFYTSSDIESGENFILTDSVPVGNKTGEFYIIAIVNEERDLNELIYSNNESEAMQINLTALYQVDVYTDKTIYKSGEKIQITGQAVGKEVANKDVDLYIINDGYQEVFNVETDGQGKFQYIFTPENWQIGHFSIGACYPEGKLENELTEIDMIGLRKNNSNVLTCKVLVDEVSNGKIELFNPTNLQLTNIKAEVISSPKNCEITFGEIPSIEAQTKGALTYQIRSTVASETNDWEEIKVRIYSAEGAEYQTTLYFYCYPKIGKITSDVEYINATVTSGNVIDKFITITNQGLAETGEISISIPDVSWLKLLVPNKIPSIKSGESASIGYQLIGNEDLMLNVPISTNIVFNAKNSSGVMLPLTVEKVTGTYGALELTVYDEFTYNSNENLSGVNVVVENPYTREIIATGTTDENGIFSRENIPAGIYDCTLSKSNHEDKIIRVEISAERVCAEKIMLLYTPISYSWEVVRTEIEDVYEFELVTKFETNVPMPVIVMNIPDEIPDLNPGESSMVNAYITNKGLVSAFDVHVKDPEHTHFSFDVLVTDFEELPSQSTVKVPIKVTRNNDFRSIDTKAVIDCEVERDVVVHTFYKRKCNYETGEWMYYQIYGELTLPKFDLECKVNVPDLPSYPIPVEPSDTEPGYLPIAPTNPVKVTTVKPAIPQEKEQETEDCRKDCFFSQASMPEDILSVINDFDELRKALPKTAIASFRTGLKKTNLLASSFQLGYDITNWTMECFDPYLDQLAKRLPDQYNRLAEAAKKDIEYLNKAVNALKESDNKREALHDLLFDDPEWIDEPYKNEFLTELFKCLDENAPVPPEKMPETLLEFGLEKADDKLKEKVWEKISDSFWDYLESLTTSLRSDDGNSELDWNEVLKLIADIEAIEQIAIDEGHENTISFMTDALHRILNDYEQVKPSGCTTVTISFGQKTIMTREAFLGTLIINNPHLANPIDNINLDISVLDANGNDCSSLFQIEPYYNLENVYVENGNKQIRPQSSGRFSVLYIPEKGAAPTQPIDYYFTGFLSYKNPYAENGEITTHQLFPVKLSVNPSPNLKLTYFMQRDILGDDPLTGNKVEPSVPAEFALLIQNTGAGDATNVNMVTNQPEIVDNEKGLAIDFELLSSTLNGEEESLALGGSVTTAFGTIPAGQTSYAQWWFRSSLLGHFTDYEVTATHVTSYDNPDLSLLDGDPTIHELIRSVKVPNSDLAGFLVNDLVDAEDQPDMIYLTDGTVQKVNPATGSITSNSDSKYTLTVTPSASGWIYGSITDPTGGAQKLVSIKRGDGTEIDLQNIWQTNCTLRDGKEPLYENRIHFADNISAVTTYELTFEPGPSVILSVSSFEGMPSDNEVAEKPVTELTVHFNKAIHPETFTIEDLTLIWQGEQQEVTPIVITQQDEQTYVLDLTEVTKLDGYYVLTVQTAEIEDLEGFYGTEGKSVSWTQYLAPGYQTLSMNLSAGWNWISTNMEGVSNPIALLTPIQEKVKRMQNQTQEITHDPNLGLVGNLESISPETFYKLEMNADGQIDITGTALSPNQVRLDLKQGWNWIGYIPRSATSPTKALALLTADVGDEVKGQEGFAQFNGTTWIGTLEQMEPGKGYMYRAKKAQSFQYPIIGASVANAALRSADVYSAANNPIWTVDIHKYPNNMSVIADLWADGVKQEPGVYTVAAFCGDECRGIGEYVDGKLFMTVYGEGKGETITFRAVRDGQSTQWAIRETIAFTENTQGSLEQPLALNLTNQVVTGIMEINRQTGIYPNPVSHYLYIKGDVFDIRQVRVVNTNGAVLFSRELDENQGLDVSTLVPGMYILIIDRGDVIESHKFIKK